MDNISVKEIRYNRARRQIGFVTQETQLFAGTVRQNLLFAKSDATETEMMDALDKASAAYLVTWSGKGLDTILGEGGMNLSGGEKQRLSFARALLRHPRLLIFDEAISALDSIHRGRNCRNHSIYSFSTKTNHYTNSPSSFHDHAW